MSLRSAVPKLDQPVLVSADDSTGDLSLALGFDDLGDLFLERSDSDELVNLNVHFWPIRKARSVAWFSTAGFHHRSKWKTWLAGSQVQPCPTGLEREDEETRAIHHAVALGFGNLSAQP